MSRNFGLTQINANQNVTTRAAVGGNQPRGPHIGADTHADNVIQLVRRSSPARLNSRSQEVEPFFHPFEFGSYCLLFGVCALPALFVCAAVFFYAAFIA
jgi:hypothetical protein